MRFAGRLMDLVHVTSRVQIARYRRPSSVAIACLPCLRRTIVSVRIRTVRAHLFQEQKKIGRKFQHETRCALCVDFNAQLLR